MSVETVTTARTEARAVDVRDALTACLLSASKDRTLPALVAVQVKKEGDVLTFTSTDRYRLTVATVRLDVAQGDDFTALVASDDVKRIADSLPKRGVRTNIAPAWFTRSDDKLTVSTYDGELTVRTMYEDYPRVDKIIPGPETELAGASRLGFMPSYMADLCKMPGRRKSEPVVLDIVAPNKPFRATWGDSDSVQYVHIIMPTRVEA